MRKLSIAALIVLLSLLPASARREKEEKCPYNIYVMMGFHTSFYHSWRGDSNDEAGFGTDIRVVRGILKQLNEANAKGLEAKGYWDIDIYFTVEEIISKYAPDIIEGIKKRVDAGLDEVLPAPYNNGILSAQTPYELEKSVSWTLSNPFGSGLKQIFGTVTPIFRPQEAMTTPGIIPIMKKAGIEGIILPYSSFPFTSFSNFVPPLTVEQRYGTLWLRHETGPDRLALIPCYSQPDALNYGSLELWMRNLRKMQEKGIIKSDLLIHYNIDADAETWLPLDLPYGLSHVPNTGGVMEIVEAVNKHEWAHFATPGEYLKDHPPSGEVVVRQDTADGAFDGYYSWAEKFESQATWTAIEQSRLYTYRSQVAPPQDWSRKALWGDRDSAFWYRLISLSTTHFGMSTPIINEERQAAAVKLSHKALELAENVYRKIMEHLEEGHAEDKSLYSFIIFNYPRNENGRGEKSKAPVRIPLILEKIGKPVLKDGSGNPVPASLINVEELGEGKYFAELTFVAELGANESRSYSLDIEQSDIQSPPAAPLENGGIKLELSEGGWPTSFVFDGKSYGGLDFIQPFISYRTRKKPVVYGVKDYKIDRPENEYLIGMKKARLSAEIPIETPSGEYAAKCVYDLSLYDGLPYLIVDVSVDYPYTPPRDLIATVQQKLRRLLDLRWYEVGPFAMRPDITAPEDNPLVIWKHNYLGVTSSYSLNYGSINPKNKELDSFNHQITNGWVAVTNGDKGLLIAQDSSVNALFAFAPMRLRVKNGLQRLYINPFGTYFGKQLDYSQIDRRKIATDMAIAVAAHMRPSGPSFNGKHERFRLMLAPYTGGEPPEEIQRDAMAFFYPFGVRFINTPLDSGVILPEDVTRMAGSLRLARKMKSGEPLPPPGALLANPTDGAIDLVWDIPEDERVTGFDVRWRSADSSDWNEKRIGRDRRYRITGLENGSSYAFEVRTVSGDRTGPWANEVEGIPGPVKEQKLTSAAKGVSVGLIMRLAGRIITHMILIH